MTRIKKKQAAKPMLCVKELFTDIEGEGQNQGFASLFVRLAGCNLRCVYCDTKYSYGGGIGLEPAYVADMIKASGFNYVNITGGEPLLQKKAVKELISCIRKKSGNIRVSVETNGSIDIRGTGAHMISMDWKLPGSGESKKMLKNNLSALKKSDQLKLVVSSEADLEYAAKMLKGKKVKALIVAQPVYGKFPVKKIAEFVILNRLNWKVGLQLHKFL